MSKSPKLSTLRGSIIRNAFEMNLKDTVLLWNTRTKAFRVTRLGSTEMKKPEWQMSAGAVYEEWKTCTPERRLILLFAEVFTLMVRDGIPFHEVHNELVLVSEYVSLFPESVP